jgi:hypothetical protein
MQHQLAGCCMPSMHRTGLTPGLPCAADYAACRGERARTGGRRPRTGAGVFYHPGPRGPEAGSFKHRSSKIAGRRPQFHLPALEDRRLETAYFRPGPGPQKFFFSSSLNIEKSQKFHILERCHYFFLWLKESQILQMA